mgnify:CR=1 FL=1
MGERVSKATTAAIDNAIRIGAVSVLVVGALHVGGAIDADVATVASIGAVWASIPDAGEVGR